MNRDVDMEFEGIKIFALIYRKHKVPSDNRRGFAVFAVFAVFSAILSHVKWKMLTETCPDILLNPKAIRPDFLNHFHLHHTDW